MLVLTRKIAESIVILLPTGERIIVKVVGIDPRGQIKLGIEAPKHIPVHRQEIFAAIEQEKAK